MDLFITILAWVFFVWYSIRIVGVIIAPRSSYEQKIMAHAKAHGRDLIIETLKWPVIIWVVCVAWIASGYLQ